MTVTLVVVLISAVVALLSAAITVWGQLRAVHVRSELLQERSVQEKRESSAEIVSSYQDPLSHATYDLQSRLFNILQREFLGVYLTNGDKREKGYATNNTVFLIAQFFGWSEIIRKEIQFLDQGDAQKTRELYTLLNKVKRLWATDKYSSVFRIFAGGQRAIGERMIRGDLHGVDCLGYSDFLETIEANRIPLISEIGSDVMKMSENHSVASERLTEIQHMLVDLTEFCDPEHVRFPKELEKA